MRRRASAITAIGSALIGSTCLITTLPGLAAAQNADANANTNTLEEVVVTGIRASLQSSTDAKKAATGFQDSIFAEDIGKFPDTNIAESFNRIPGITIVRETSGEGLNIAVRGLGTNFTKILLNDAPVAIASTGRTDAQNTNREVDLDLFPTELFTQLTVKKSSSANMLEGGAAGTVNMRSARPFDREGQHLTFSFQGTRNSEADQWGERGSILGSKSWDTFGVLVGVAGVRNKVRTTGFETIGWTNPNLTATQCGAASGCNSTGGGNWNIPATVPTGAGNGLNAGDTIDRAFLLARNPSLTNINQLDNALIPRLGRPSDEFGTKDRYNGVVSFEYRPTDSLHFYVDSMYGKKANDMQRIDMNWVGRFGSMVPLNVTVDRPDCATGCVVTSGTFANAQLFLEYRPFIEDTKFWGVNPGFDWQLTENLKVDLQANKTHSDFHRESPTVLVITPLGNGTTVTLTNDGGTPRVTANLDLNNPANFGWPGGRVNMQDERRVTDTKGVRTNFTFDKFQGMSLRAGAAYDDVSRRINAFDNTTAWQSAICGDDPSIVLPSPNSAPPCEGLVTATPPANYPTYPGLGTFFTQGNTTPLVYRGSLISNADIASFLRPGPSGFITADWDAIKAASNYDTFHDAAPEVGSSNTGANGGFVQEKSTGVYAEIDGDTEVNGNRLRYSAGLRRVRTAQTIGGRVSITDPRNVANATPPATQIADGGRFPNLITFALTDHTYYNTLPSFEVAYNVSEQAIVRLAGSRTITRPDPNAMLPGLSFSAPSADVATIGNSALAPFESENVDLGFEYYTGREGYFGVAAFRKRVTGFTTNGLTTMPFSDLAVYGVTFDTLTPQQQGAITARGGPGVATVVVQQQVNASGALTVNGLEFNWVQPLDFVRLNGFGIAANLTLINQSAKGAAPAIAVGVAPHTYNAMVYYDRHGVSARLSTTFTEGSQAAGANQNGIPAAALFSDSYEQWDFSSSFDLAEWFSWQNKVEITLDAVNLFNKQQRSYFQFENAAFTNYIPGRQYFIGVRGSF
jgi:TonB-dependent receptor